MAASEKLQRWLLPSIIKANPQLESIINYDSE